MEIALAEANLKAAVQRLDECKKKCKEIEDIESMKHEHREGNATQNTNFVTET